MGWWSSIPSIGGYVNVMKFKKSWFYWWGHGIDSVMEYRLIVTPGFIDKPKKDMAAAPAFYYTVHKF